MAIPSQPIDRAPDLAMDAYALAALNVMVRGDNLGADASPAGNDGTPAGRVTSMPVGARFDGVDDTIDFGDIGNIQQVSMWVNPVTTTEQLFLVDAGNYVHIVAGTVTYVGLTAAATYVNDAASTTLAAGEWQLLVCQFTQIDANNFEIAVDGAANFGAMDAKDIRAMDAVWTAARVAYEYQQGVPDDSLALWTMGGQSDLSRNELPITNNNGVATGGHHIEFHGAAAESLQTTAQVLTGGMTVSLRFNAAAVAQTVLFNNVEHLDRRLVIMTQVGNEMRAGYWQGAVYRSASGTAYYANRWHHVYCTWDADETVRLWLDSVELTGAVDPSSGNALTLRLGSSTGGTSEFTGLMRDARVWLEDKGEEFGQILYRTLRRAY